MSESNPSSKASDRVLSASDVMGSSERRGLVTGDEARDRKDGGGEDGMDSRVFEVGGVIGLSSWSLSETCNLMSRFEAGIETGLGVDVGMRNTYSFVALGSHDKARHKLSDWNESSRDPDEVRRMRSVIRVQLIVYGRPTTEALG